MQMIQTNNQYKIPNLNSKSIISALAKHYLSQPYRPEYNYSNVVNVDGQYLGPYIPYVGQSYLTTKPRILIYAMAQNLHRAKGLMKIWLNNPDNGLLRQYYDLDTPIMHVYPYDTGHLKVIAALALTAYPKSSYQSTDNVNDLIAVTNFVKFSFYKKDADGKTFDINPPLDIYHKMLNYYCKFEIELLQPDVIVGVGKDVHSAINRHLIDNNGIKPLVIGIPFPGRLNLNSQWVPEGKRLVKLGQSDPQRDINEIVALVEGTPDRLGKIRKAIKTDWYYFREIKKYLVEVFENRPISNTKLKTYCH